MKNCEEWENGFDLLYQNITSNQAPGLNAYEKSKFLTQAQEVVVIGLYNGTFRNSFEETEEVTRYLAPLFSQKSCTEMPSAPHVVENSKVYKLPEDLMFRTLELCTVNIDGCGERPAVVVPVTQDEFWRTTRNPFKKQNNTRVLRLTQGTSGVLGGDLLVSGYSELVSDNDIVNYTVRYIKRPEPIILCNLEDGLTIDGESSAKTCKLDEHIHQAILEEAVQRAKAVWKS